MIARLHLIDVGADLLDHAGGFMAEQLPAADADKAPP